MVKSNNCFNFELDNQIYNSTDLSVRVSLQVLQSHGHTQKNNGRIEEREDGRHLIENIWSQINGKNTYYYYFIIIYLNLRLFIQFKCFHVKG